MLLIILPISLGTRDGKVELVTFLQVFHRVLKRLQRQSHARDEGERIIHRGFLAKLFLAVFQHIHLIGHSNVLILCLFHTHLL